MKITQDRSIKDSFAIYFPIFPGVRIVGLKSYRHISAYKSQPYWGVVQIEFTLGKAQKIHEKMSFGMETKSEFIKNIRHYFLSVDEKSLQDAYAKFVFDNSSGNLILLVDRAHQLQRELDLIAQKNEKIEAQYQKDFESAREGRRTKRVEDGWKTIKRPIYMGSQLVKYGFGDDGRYEPHYIEQTENVRTYREVPDYPEKPQKLFDSSKEQELREVKAKIEHIKSLMV